MEGFSNYFEDNYVINLYLNNPDISIKEISLKTNNSIGEIYRILQSNLIKPNRNKLHYNNVIEFAKSGLPINRIAELTGYSSRNVRYILFGRN